MHDFGYLFSFYGLLLGLAAANVATGFADMWRERRAVAVGVAPPLLALVILLGSMNLWLRFWAVRQSVEFDAWSLIILTCVALPYVFLSRAIPAGGRERVAGGPLPRAPADHPDHAGAVAGLLIAQRRLRDPHARPELGDHLGRPGGHCGAAGGGTVPMTPFQTGPLTR